MLPSNLNLKIGKTKGYNNEILVSNAGLTIGSNKNVNKDSKKLPVSKADVPKTVIPATRHEPVGAPKSSKLKMLTKKHNDEKIFAVLLIVGSELIAYHFW